MKKLFWAILALALASMSSAVWCADEQPAPAPQPSFKLIQEVPVPQEYMVVGDMKVSGDGSMVLYIVQIAGDKLEYAAMGNKTRLPNQLLDVAKKAREQTGNDKISLEPADYVLTMIGDLVPSPLWQGVVYGAMTAKAGPVVLVNRLKTPDFPSAFSVSGAYPSWYYSFTGGESAAFWAQKDGKIELFADGETAIEDGAMPTAAAVIRGSTKAYVTAKDGRRSLFVDGKKVGDDYDSIEPMLFTGQTGADYKVAYIGINANKSVLIVDGKEVKTEFPPAHDLTIAAGGKPIAYVASNGGREFVVQDGARIIQAKDFAKVRMLTYDKTRTKLAYVVRDADGECVMINDKKVTPTYQSVTFCQEQFRIKGDLTFAGFDGPKKAITVGALEKPAQ